MTVLSILVLLASGIQPTQAGAQDRFDWVLGSVHVPLQANQYVFLKNLTNNNKCVEYQEREYGINLGWSVPNFCLLNIKLVRQYSANTPIQVAEPLAIFVYGGGYLHYQSRKYGINLVWSKVPVYEWSLAKGSVWGTIYQDEVVSIYNSVERDYMVYCEREYGINLKWSGDCSSIRKDIIY